VKIGVLEKKKVKLEESVSELESQVESVNSEKSSKDQKIQELETKLNGITEEKIASEKALEETQKQAEKVSSLVQKQQELEKVIDKLITEEIEKG
jgi:predicted  nucleic acid-binding Zn-ribbon protein